MQRASTLGVPCEVVVPEPTPRAKTDKIAAYGAQITRHGSTYNEAQRYGVHLTAERGAYFADACSQRAAAGQGTLILEMLEQVPDAHYILVPFGGGTFAAAAIAAADAFEMISGRKIPVIGVEPEGAACGFESLKAGRPITFMPDTYAEGLRTEGVDLNQWEAIRDKIGDIVKVPERYIKPGMALLSRICGSPVEASSVPGPMAIVSSQGMLVGARGQEIDLRGKKVLAPITGGNVSQLTLDSLQEAMP